jgi:hypothetical protein
VKKQRGAIQRGERREERGDNRLSPAQRAAVLAYAGSL